ncbi:ATP-dependent DNA ligase [Haloferula chungangensis]|uniref:DNA ligase n=1 Tax=Haloferula chungangensis TaxID=1048331 RepID=A0ABW2L609_9BACT
MAEEIQIQARPAGIYLPEIDLWLDPRGQQNRAFISHAHADHHSRPEQAFCSRETAHLLFRRFGLKKDSLTIIEADQTLDLDGFELSIQAAGHVVGSSMLHLRRKSDGHTLLFTGDFKTLATRTCPAPSPLSVDTLIIETTYGRPEYIFPPRHEVENSIVTFIHAAFDASEVPILCAYSLGKAQELSALLADHDIVFQAHSSIIEMNDACRELGVALPQADKIQAPIPPRHAVLCPPSAIRSTVIRRLKNKQTAMISGWGIHPNARYRYQVDHVFPLSDHADYRELLDFVDAVDPSRIYTIHGSTREFAADLRARGRQAWSLFTDDQLELIPRQLPRVPSATNHHRIDRPLSMLNERLNEVQALASRTSKRELLASLISPLNENELSTLVDWLSERSLKLGFGFASIRLALLKAFSITLADYRSISNQQQDAARTARILSGLHGDWKASSTPFSAPDLSSLIDFLRNCRVQLDAIHELAGTLRRLPPPEVEFVLRVLTREFRIGSREGLLEEAIAEAFSADPREVARAHMLTGDLGSTAVLAKQKRCHEAELQIGTPVKVMLASPAPDATAIYAKLATPESTVWLEDKFDGIRAQLHKRGDNVHLFSRDLRSLDAEFPELIRAATNLPDCLLDGEIIAFEEGRQLSFFDLQKRLGRKQKHRGQGDLFHPQDTPVRFIAFDLLHHDRQSLWQKPLRTRRAQLEAIKLQAPFECARQMLAADAEEIDTHFKQARARANEGLIAKDPESPYHFGRRGQSWLKLKKVQVTLDCLVTHAQQGHGGRAGLLSDYTFAVRDEANGQLRVIGKAYSGLTDAEIEELTEHFKKTTIDIKRRVHLVEPQIVLEIAFDSIRPSKRHDSGLAMRFPRIKAIRRDKSPEEIDTLQFAQTLVS